MPGLIAPFAVIPFLMTRTRVQKPGTLLLMDFIVTKGNPSKDGGAKPQGLMCFLKCNDSLAVKKKWVRS